MTKRAMCEYRGGEWVPIQIMTEEEKKQEEKKEEEDDGQDE